MDPMEKAILAVILTIWTTMILMFGLLVWAVAR